MSNFLNKLKENDSKIVHYDSHEAKSNKKLRLCNYIVNMVHFGLSIILITVGILYLTGFKFDYSFNKFSTNLIAGLFIAIGFVTLLLCVFNIYLIQSNKHLIFLISTTVLFVLFISLLSIGIWGLVASSEDNIQEETKLDMMETFKKYDDKNLQKFETKKVDWLHQRFNCCGINSYTDWKSYYLYGGQFKPTNYVDQWTINFNLPYMDHVPDSCCVNQAFSCGKLYANNVYPSTTDRSSVIYVKGCFYNYLNQFSKHIVFLAGLSVAVSSIEFVLWIVLVAVYLVFRVRH